MKPTLFWLRVTIFLLACLCALSTGACGVIDGVLGIGDDEGTPSGPVVPPKPPSTIAGTWTLQQPDPYVVEPGMPFRMTITGLTVDPADVLIWLENDVAIRPMGMVVLERGADDSTYADDVVAFEHVVPYVTAGSHNVALGTVDARSTGEALLYVVIPERRYPREFVATIMQDGMIRTVQGLRRRTVEAEDEALQMFMSSYLGGDRLAALTAILDGTEKAASSFESEYAQLDDKTERAFQAMLYNTGMMHWAEPRIDEYTVTHPTGAEGSLGTSRAALAVTGPFDFKAHPVHRVFFELDMTSMVSGVAGEMMSVVEIGFALSGVGVVVSAAVAVINFVNAIVQVVIDNVLPTDLVAVETHDQRSLYDGQPAAWIYWGTFQPENTKAEALSFDSIVAQVIGAAIPAGGPLAKKTIEVAKAALGQLLARTGVAFADYFLTLEAPVPIPVKLAMNMQAYSLSLISVLDKIPVMRGFALLFKPFIDLELMQAVHLNVNDLPSWAQDADLELDYEDSTVAVSGVEWPEGVDRIDLQISAMMFSYKTRQRWLWRYPGWETLEILHKPVTLVKKPVAINESRRDQDSIVLGVYEDGDPHGAVLADGYIKIDTPKQRTLILGVYDPFSNPMETAAFSAFVNGELVVDQKFFDPPSLGITLELKPGRNDVTFRCDVEHSETGYLWIGVYLPGLGPLQTAMRLYEGETHTIHIWMPPLVSLDDTPGIGPG